MNLTLDDLTPKGRQYVFDELKYQADGTTIGEFLANQLTHLERQVHKYPFLARLRIKKAGIARCMNNLATAA